MYIKKLILLLVTVNISLCSIYRLHTWIEGIEFLQIRVEENKENEKNLLKSII